MDNNTQDRSVVIAVVLFLGLQAVGGLAALVFLIWSGVEANALIAVTSAQNLAAGALAGILAMTRTGNAAAEAKGAAQALAQVKELAAVVPPVIGEPAESMIDPPPADPSVSPMMTQAISTKRVTPIRPPFGFGPVVRAGQ